MTLQHQARDFWFIAACAFARFLVHLVITLTTPYEIHRDEFLYLAMGEHLRLWAMDFPPAIALLANFSTGLFGDNLFAVRFTPALAGAAIVAMTGLLVRELGGRRPAQAVAMLCVCCSPLFLRAACLFQPVVFDQLWWTVAFYAVVRLLYQSSGSSPEQASRVDEKTIDIRALSDSASFRQWLLLGVACGLGLLTKFSILFFGLALVGALLLGKHRAVFLGRGPWMAAAIALVIGAPTIMGQLRLGLPVLIHMEDLQTEQLHRVTYAEFLTGQVLMFGPSIIVAAAGFVYLGLVRAGSRLRAVAVTCAGAFLLLMILHGKAYYIGPIYPTLFAAGAVFAWELRGRVALYARRVLVALIVVAGALCSPFGLPFLPPEPMARYAARLGIQAAVKTNTGTVLPLPQDYADMIGWKEQVQAVASAFRTLPSEVQSRAWLIARNSGQAGAMEFYGPRFGLPRRIMLPDNFLLWPAAPSCDAAISIDIPPADLKKFFGQVEIIGHFDHPWMVEWERHSVICRAEEPVKDLREAWRKRSGRLFRFRS